MLNPHLFAQLERIFDGNVEVVNEDAPLVIVKRRNYEGREVPWKEEGGEQYRMNCPCCGDLRARLYVHHAWGLDGKHKYPTSKLVVCHNEQCHSNRADPRVNPREYLRSRLRPYFSDVKRGIIRLDAPTKSRRERARVEKIPFPALEWVTPVHELPVDHIGRTYLESRKFDVMKLFSEYGVVYINQYPVKMNNKDYSWLAGWLAYPVFNSVGSMDAWQARVLEPTPGFHMKYFNCPGWKKSESLYGINEARAHSTVLLVEGVTDVWRVGDKAVCTFGKNLSHKQLELVVDNWDSVGIMYDADATKDIKKASALLRRRVSNVFTVSLPDGRDPADCTVSQIEQAVERARSSAGLV